MEQKITFAASEGTMLLLRSAINQLLEEVIGWNRGMASGDINGVYDDVIDELYTIRNAIDDSRPMRAVSGEKV